MLYTTSLAAFLTEKYSLPELYVYLRRSKTMLPWQTLNWRVKVPVKVLLPRTELIVNTVGAISALCEPVTVQVAALSVRPSGSSGLMVQPVNSLMVGEMLTES